MTTLTWTQTRNPVHYTGSRRTQRGSLWHITREVADPYTRTNGTTVERTRTQRLCAPQGDTFYGRAWELGGRLTREDHPLGPGGFGRHPCDKCLDRLARMGLAPGIVEPPLPSELDQTMKEYDEAMAEVRPDIGRAYLDEPTRYAYDRTTPRNIYHALGRIRAVDADKAAQLERLAREYEDALKAIIGGE